MLEEGTQENPSGQHIWPGQLILGVHQNFLPLKSKLFSHSRCYLLLSFHPSLRDFLVGGRMSLGLETFPSESHQSNRKTQGKLFLLLSKDIGFAAPISHGARSLPVPLGRRTVAALIFTLCLCSIPRLGFLPSDAPAAQVSDSLIPSPPHTCKSNFYFIQMFIHLSYMYVVTLFLLFSCGMKTGDLTTTEVGNLTQRREDPGM